MSNLKIAVIMGGLSDEHPVSLKSGEGVVNHLDYGEYDVCPVVVTRDGRWHCADEYTHYRDPKKFDAKEFLEKHPEGTRTFPIFLLAENGRPDMVFPVLHGKWGEDGTLQGLLTMYGLAFTGSGVLGSALAIHKRKAKELYQQQGLNTPDYSFYTRRQWEENPAAVVKNAVDKLGLPMFIKIPEGGSSLGLGRAATREAAKELCEKFFRVAEEVLFEKRIEGTEVTCGILETASGESEALTPTEIVPLKADFFDFEAKYKAGATQEITPARLPSLMLEKVQRCAATAHRALHCRDISRTDMIISGEKIYVLETNTLPGMTETSLIPQGAKASGISYSELLDRIIHSALNRAK